MRPSGYYNSISEGYEELHRAEQEKKLKIIKERLMIRPDDRLLDVGCGTGITSQFDCIVTGADPAKRLIAKARKNYPDKAWVAAPAESLPFGDSSFDIVISVTAIQNFEDIEKGLKEIKRVGRTGQEGGRFALSFLRKSAKREKIARIIRRLFAVAEQIEEEKDSIFFCTTKLK